MLIDAVSTLRHAGRQLVRSPGFTLVAVATLAVGIAANTAIFSMVNTVLLRPLPYADEDELVWLNATAPQRGESSLPVSYPDFLDWRRQNDVFTSMAAYDDQRFYLSAGGETERVSGAAVSPELFAVLGVAALEGRVFLPEEGEPGGPPVALVGHALWQRRFGGRADLLGRTLEINGRSCTVVGIMPPRFHFPEYADLWLPLALDAAAEPREGGRLSVVARLAPGVSREQARRQMEGIAERLAAHYPESNAGVGVTLLPLRRYYVGATGAASLVFLAATGFLLLIVCANLANLLLGRAAARQREIALRLALGAGRGRLLRQLLLESVLLALLGVVPGLALGYWGVHLLVDAIPVDLPFWADFGFDLRVVAFMVAAAVATGVLFGLAPALQSLKTELNETLKVGKEMPAFGSRRRPLTQVLVVFQVAVSLALLAAAGLMVWGFLDLQRVDPGFRAGGVLTARVTPSASPIMGKYREPHEQRALQERLLEAVGAMAGVEAVTTGSSLPLRGGPTSKLALEGAPAPAEGEDPSVYLEAVGPDYFATLGVPLRAGRLFDRQDDERAVPAAIVNEAFAERFGSGMVGRRLKLARWDEEAPWVEVVGVVGDVRQRGFDEPPRPAVYVPFAQRPNRFLVLFVRTAADPLSLAGPLRRAVWRVDSELPVDAVRTLPQVVDEALWQPALYSWLLGLFAAMALLLAVLGVYGVVSCSVARRTREISIRMALGARPRNVLRAVLGQALAAVAIGLVLGSVGAVGLSGVLASFLPGFGEADAGFLSVLAAAFAAVAAAAALVPAWRAVRVDPMRTLRCE